MGAGFSLFFIFIAIKIMNKHLDKDILQPKVVENPNLGETKLINYFPIIFHLTIISLILFSCFRSGIMSEARIGLLISDGIFQFVSTMLIYIITLINPFVSFSTEMRKKITDKAQEQEFNWLNWLLKNRNWQLLKGLACIAIIGYCIYKGYLVIPNLNQGVLSGIAVVLIFFFVLSNIIQLIQNPVLFKQKTLFRLSMLYKSFKLVFLISIGLIITILVFIFVLKIDQNQRILISGSTLLVYNVVMAYNEFKILRAD